MIIVSIDEEDIPITDQENGKFSYELKRLGHNPIKVEDLPTKAHVISSVQDNLTLIINQILK